MAHEALVVLVLAYLIGSVPSAYLVARVVAGIDIRTVGDASVGTRNVAAQVGTGAGIFVAVMDIGKGLLAIQVAETLRSDSWLIMLAGFVRSWLICPVNG